VRTDGPQIAGSAAAADAGRDWQAVRDQADIQFSPLPPMKPPEPPSWLKWLGEQIERFFEFLRDVLAPVGNALGLSWPAMKIVLIVLAVTLVLFVLWRLLAPLIGARRERIERDEEEWAPTRDAAEALLEEADRLAAQGLFAEATHLLLKRSVHHIAEAHPGWLAPSVTSREIASLEALPERARAAFATIAQRVERSLFALRELDRGDWTAARAAYADFALAELR
jgi:hypothetical protein